MRSIIVLVALLALSSPGRAQSIEVAPVTITFLADQRTAELTLTNRGVVPITVQVRPFRWDEAEGTASLSDTTALAVSPPIAEVAAGQSQLVRMLLRTGVGPTEASYRLLVDELPPALRPNAVQVMLRLSLPVFAQPSGGGEAMLDWQIEAGQAGGTLRVHNRGTRHAKIVGMQIMTGREGAALGESIAVRTAAHPYVLPGATVRWPVPGSRRWNGAEVSLRVTSDAGVSTATAHVISADPR